MSSKVKYNKNKFLQIVIIFFLFFFNIISFSLQNKYITFLLKTLPQEINIFSKGTTQESIMKQFNFNNLYLILELGMPVKKVPALLLTDYNEYFITSPKFDEKFNYMTKPIDYNFTKYFHLFHEYDYYLNNSNFYVHRKCYRKQYDTYREFNTYCYSYEIFYFYNNEIISKENQISKKNFYFNYVFDTREKIPAKIGLPQPNALNIYFTNFLSMLKENKIIEKFYYFINLDKDKNAQDTIGKLIIGSYPHEVYPDKFKEKDLIFVKRFSSKTVLPENWMIYFSDIFIRNYSFTKTIGEFNYYSDIIIGPYELRDYLKEKYLNEAINKNYCFESSFIYDNIRKLKYNYYYCKKEQKEILYEIIPKISFYSYEFNNTFFLTKEDLFKVNDDGYIYFLLGFSEDGTNSNIWKLGKNFMKKYLFVFDYENEKIGMYLPSKEKSNKLNFNEKIKYYLSSGIFITIIVLLIGITIGVIIGKIIIKERKKRANELKDDDYDYNINEEQ